jgi:hypothetical protein
MKRIAGDQELASVVSSYPVCQYVPEAMLRCADEVGGHRAVAETLAKENGFQAIDVDRQAGSYIGRIVAVTDKYVVHEIGMLRAVAHRRDDLLLLPDPKPNDNLKVQYQGGRGTVIRKDKSLAHER